MIATRRIFLLLLAVLWVVSVSPGRAQEAEKAFYAGKTVRMVVGTGVGGGYDVFSRLIAPYLAKTLGTTVVVENQPGAGGLLALNKLYAAPPDGLQISLSQGTMAAVAQLMGDQAVRFDLTKFSYLASARRPACGWWDRTLRSARCSRRSMRRRSGDGRLRVERRAWGSARPSPARR